MRPTFSIICFTVLSGAGYGVWFVLGCGLVFFWPTCTTAAPFVACTYPVVGTYLFVVGFGLVTSGLICSLGHLGKPLRAWRALSQWRSSWLSREGVAALLTYVPAIAIPLVLLTQASQSPDAVLRPIGAVLGLMCVVTVYCTAHIYSSLKPIRAWHNRYVTPAYLLIALHAGLLWMWALSMLSRVPAARVREIDTTLIALALTSFSLVALKLFYWRSIDAAPRTGPGHATGLESLGDVRTFEAPNTEENYLTHEMGFVLARKLAQQLRTISLVFAFAGPGVLALLALASPSLRIFAAFAALVGGMLGLFVERWLFFAEARHTVIAFYGR
ncbi:MAG TPA: DmsC/YnfH family molybdoenzyme membrane anchor subunit [Rhodanobacteraceae bacterium]|nr:DmsC/YnfH family molybdoenzyme membrane anchor subunit [Rhodanobacteraceae bacterium]